MPRQNEAFENQVGVVAHAAPFSDTDILFCRHQIHSAWHDTPIPQKYLQNSKLWKPSVYQGVYSYNYLNQSGIIAKKFLSFLRLQLPHAGTTEARAVVIYLGSSENEIRAAYKYDCAIQIYAALMRKQGFCISELPEGNFPVGVTIGDAPSTIASIEEQIKDPVIFYAHLLRVEETRNLESRANFLPAFDDDSRRYSFDSTHLGHVWGEDLELPDLNDGLPDTPNGSVAHRTSLF